MANESQIAIYHPYIDIDDGSLIKTAALYWDKLQTIVPESVYEPYQNKSSKEACELNFLEPRYISDYDDEVLTAGNEFLEDIKQREIKTKLINIFKSQRVKNGKYAQIHFEKFNPLILLQIRDELHTEIPFSPVNENTLIIPSVLMCAYLSRVATTLSLKDNSSPLTNAVDYQNILLDKYTSYEQEHRDNQCQLANLSLKTISIDPSVPLADILRFKDNHTEMLLGFRRKIRKLARQVARGLNTADKQNAFEKIIKDEVLPAKSEIETKLNENSIQFLIMDLVIAITSVAAIVSYGGQAWLSNFAQGAVALTANSLLSIRQDRNIIREHPLGYLYRAYREFGANK